MTYENLIKQAGVVNILEKQMPLSIKGLYSNGTIWINRSIPSQVEKACVLAEELGHHYTSSGDILDQKQLQNRKQEKRARKWAYERLVPLISIAEAHRSGIKNRFELAFQLNVTEEFLNETIKYYMSKYGLYTRIEGYTICFEPLGLLEIFE